MSTTERKLQRRLHLWLTQLPLHRFKRFVAMERRIDGLAPSNLHDQRGRF